MRTTQERTPVIRTVGITGSQKVKFFQKTICEDLCFCPFVAVRPILGAFPPHFRFLFCQTVGPTLARWLADKYGKEQNKKKQKFTEQIFFCVPSNVRLPKLVCAETSTYSAICKYENIIQLSVLCYYITSLQFFTRTREGYKSKDNNTETNIII